MDERLDYLIGCLDLHLVRGHPPVAAWAMALNNYAYVYHNKEEEGQTADSRRTILASELIRQLEELQEKHGDLPVDLSVDYEVFDDTRTARGALDCVARYCPRTSDRSSRILIESSGS